MSAPLVARVVSRESIDTERRRVMLGLMHLCYEGVSPERFAADLDAKQYVILLFARESEELVGFSTMRLAQERIDGRTVDVAYSGDTVIHPDYWGAKTLQAAFGHFLLFRRLRRPWRPCLWLLLSGGYKTYLMMVNNFPHSIPSLRHPVEPRMQRLMEDVTARWFGEQYDRERGVVRFAAHYRVRAGVVPIDAQVARHPDVAFFLSHNPNHHAGDELVCLAELRLRDLLRTMLRALLYQARMMPRRTAARDVREGAMP